MGIGNKRDQGNKGSNFNWQKRMLALASDCCVPTLTTDEMNAWTDAPPGKIVYNSTDDSLYFFRATLGTWVKFAP